MKCQYIARHVFSLHLQSFLGEDIVSHFHDNDVADIFFTALGFYKELSSLSRSPLLDIFDVVNSLNFWCIKEINMGSRTHQSCTFDRLCLIKK